MIAESLRIAFEDGQLFGLNHDRPEDLSGLIEESVGPIGRIFRSKVTGEDLRATVTDRGSSFFLALEDVESEGVVGSWSFPTERLAVLRAACFVLGLPFNSKRVAL